MVISRQEALALPPGVVIPRIAWVLLQIQKKLKPGRRPLGEPPALEIVNEALSYLMAQVAMASFCDTAVVPKSVPPIENIKDLKVIAVVDACIHWVEIVRGPLEELAISAYIPDTNFKKVLLIGARGFIDRVTKSALAQPVCEPDRLPRDSD